MADLPAGSGLVGLMLIVGLFWAGCDDNPNYLRVTDKRHTGQCYSLTVIDVDNPGQPARATCVSARQYAAHEVGDRYSEAP